MNIRSFLIIFAMSSLLYSEENFGIVVHGGAGVMSGLSEERQQQIYIKRFKKQYLKLMKYLKRVVQALML